MKFKKISFIKKIPAIIATISMLVCSAVSSEAASIQNYIPDSGLGDSAMPYTSTTISFPLSSYPDGSYYSSTGSACTCHDWCKWYSNCTCIKYDSSAQCAAFAKYIFYLAKGYHYSSGTKTEENTSLTSSNVASYLQGLSTGTYIRVNTSNGYVHSLAIVSTNSNGITVYHANYGGACKVRYQTYTWASFATAFPYLYYYVS